MPALAVSINGKDLVTVSTEGLNVLSVRVYGDMIGPDFATIDVSGGMYSEKESTYLVWANELEIAAGDQIIITFLEAARTSYAGKTIEELHPDEDSPMGPWQPLEDMFQYLRKQPKIRDRFSFKISPPAGPAITSDTKPDDHGFGFSVLWNWMHPEQTKVLVTSHTLENIEKRTTGFEHASFRLMFGETVKLRVEN